MSGLDFSRNQKLALLALAGLGILGLSVSFARNNVSTEEIVLQEPGGRVVASDSDSMPRSKYKEFSSGQVVFQVAGCVKSPGVYSLPTGKRVIDAIRAAGGAKHHADLDSINLAEKIKDSSRIYVPSVKETRAAAAPRPAPFAATKSASAQVPVSRSSSSPRINLPGSARQTSSGAMVNINTAGVDELDELPGVGPATAQKIIDFRTSIGRFSSVDQLLDVKGIGPSKIEQMRPFVSL